MQLHLFVPMLLLLAACAAKPPVQEMAEARSAIDAARQLPGKNPAAGEMLKSAEKAMVEASSAMDAGQYDAARVRAAEAKQRASRAASLAAH